MTRLGVERRGRAGVALRALAALALVTIAIGCHRRRGVRGRASHGAVGRSGSSSTARAAAASAPGGESAKPAPGAVARPRDAAADRRWCLEQTKSHYLVFQHAGSATNPLPRAPELDCREGFAWRAVRYTAARPPDDEWLQGRYDVDILHRESDGATAVVGSLQLRVARGWGTEAFGDFTVGDVDGDGVGEVFWSVTLMEEGRRPSAGHLMRLASSAGGTRLEPVPLPGSVEPSALVDVDRDGRFDVVTNGVYGAATHETEVGGPAPWFADGLFLLRSLGGLRFDAQSPDSERWTRAACARAETPERGPEPAPGATDWRVGRNVVCARIRGASKGEVERAIRAQCRSFTRDVRDWTACPASLLELAAAEPDTHLTAPAKL